MPGYGFGGGIHAYPGSAGGGYGASLKAEYRRYYGAFVGFSGRGEQVAREDCSCEIDPTVVDKWGIPVLRFHHAWSDYERLQAQMHRRRAQVSLGPGGSLDPNDASEELRRAEIDPNPCSGNV